MLSAMTKISGAIAGVLAIGAVVAGATVWIDSRAAAGGKAVADALQPAVETVAREMADAKASQRKVEEAISLQAEVLKQLEDRRRLCWLIATQEDTKEARDAAFANCLHLAQIPEEDR